MLTIVEVARGLRYSVSSYFLDSLSHRLQYLPSRYHESQIVAQVIHIFLDSLFFGIYIRDFYICRY